MTEEKLLFGFVPFLRDTWVRVTRFAKTTRAESCDSARV